MAHKGKPHLDTKAFIDKTLTFQSADELLEFFSTTMKDIGFEYVAFFLLADNNQISKSVEAGLLYHTFPLEWTDYYSKQGYLVSDPMVERSKTSPQPFRWMLDPALEANLTEPQRQVIRNMREYGFTDGLTVPIFLPGCRIIHCALATKKGIVNISQTEVIEIGCLCHQIYTRYSELTNIHGGSAAVRLSQREMDVLYWVALGKSNSVIASILGISPHTVDTMLRRCFKKLDVSNRTSAVLKAVSTGLINP